MRNIWVLNHYAMPPQLGSMVRHYKFGENLVAKGHQVTIFAASAIHNTSLNVASGDALFTQKQYGSSFTK